MPAEIRLRRKPESRQFRNAVLKGMATAIIEETKKAFEARANSDYYEESEPWQPLSSAWLDHKVKGGYPSQIGIYQGSLEQAILSLGYDIQGNSVHIKVENDHADAFDSVRPLLYLPPMAVISEYIARSIQEASSGS